MAKGLVQWLTFRNPDFQIFNTVPRRQPLRDSNTVHHGYGTSVTVQDFSHCTRLRTLYPWLVAGVFFHCSILPRKIWLSFISDLTIRKFRVIYSRSRVMNNFFVRLSVYLYLSVNLLIYVSIYIFLSFFKMPAKWPHTHTHVCVVLAENDASFIKYRRFWPKTTSLE